MTDLRALRRYVPGPVWANLGQAHSWHWTTLGRRFADRWNYPTARTPRTESHGTRDSGTLRRVVHEHTTGRGLHKWEHYLDVYERHLGRFAGTDVHLLEIGVQSGGSIEMWRRWLGDESVIYGVDVDSRATRSEDAGARVFVGDQADRQFWVEFQAEVPRLDVVVDDGGHEPEQQRITLEELLPHLAPGGVYICEDVHGESNRFLSYVHGLSRALNAGQGRERASKTFAWGELVSPASPFQAAVESIHLYPFLVVIQMRHDASPEFVAPRRGDDFLMY